MVLLSVEYFSQRGEDMSAPLNAHLDLNFNNSCNCLCWKKADKPIYIDEEFVPVQYNRKRHNGIHVEETYRRIEQIIHKEFDAHDVENRLAVEMIEKITQISITGDASQKEPIRVRQLRRVIEAIDELKSSMRDLDE